MPNPYAWLQTLWLPAVVVVVAVAILYVFYHLLRLVAPKVAAIAHTTTKEGLAQPLFGVEVALGVFLMFLAVLLPYNTFGEDVRVMKDSGLTLILVLAALLATWTASVSISEELEGRTALTLLSKPVSRRQFLLGKFIGILGPVYWLFVILGGVFLVAVSFKVNFDAREMLSQSDPAEQCRREMLQILPGLVLAFLETVVLGSISTAIATRLPLVPNLIVCATIYVVGHLAPLLVQSSAGQQPLVAFVGQLLATVLPVLEYFSTQAAIASGRDVPLDYLAWAAGYSALYSAIALLTALVLFEDRDLA